MAGEHASRLGHGRIADRILTLALSMLLLLNFLAFLPRPGLTDSLSTTDGAKGEWTVGIQQTHGYFTENRGQVKGEVRYYSNDNPSIGFKDDGVMFVIHEIMELRDDGGERTVSSGEAPSSTGEGTTVRSFSYLLRFIGANAVVPVGKEELSFRSNFFLGDDSSSWLTDVPNFGEVIYENLYDGIDLVYLPQSDGLKYEFIVHPGADPGIINLGLEGAESLLLEGGTLVAVTAAGEVRDSPPISFDSSGTDVHCSFELRGFHSFGFHCDEHDIAETLTIDPLVYSTLLGGGHWDGATSVAIDSSGSAYVTGWTFSTDFTVTPGSFSNAYHGLGDAFVVKLNDTGSAPVYSTYLGGSSLDRGQSIDVDGYGCAYMVGKTSSKDFPTTPGAYDRMFDGDQYSYDAFVTKLGASGNSLVYSTFLGGGSTDSALSIAVDASNNAFVAGETLSSDFPVTPGAFYNASWGMEGFITKLGSSGSALVYSTLLGGSGGDHVTDVAIDSVGNAYVTGWTTSWNFTVTPGAFQRFLRGSEDSFVTKLRSDGGAVIYSTYLGGYDSERGRTIAVDPSGNAYVAGETYSSSFPTTPTAFNRSYGGSDDAFVTKLNATGTGLVYSTFLGGIGADVAHSIAIDSHGNAYITGETGSPDFPTTFGAFDATHNGISDVFVVNLTANGSKQSYSSFIGGASWDGGFSIAIDASFDAYIAGEAWSVDFPVTPGAFDTNHTGGREGFVTKLVPRFVNTPPVIVSFTAAPQQSHEGDAVAFNVIAKDAEGDQLTYLFDFESDGTFDLNSSDASASHIYGDDFDGNATVLVSDGRLNMSATTHIVVLNVDPSISFTVVPTGNEGGTLTFRVRVTDRGSDDLTVNWSGSCTGWSPPRSYPNDPMMFPDPYPSPEFNPRDVKDVQDIVCGDDGLFTWNLEVGDDDGGSVSLSGNFTVANLPPSLDVSPPQQSNIDEGQSVSLTATATDSGSDDLNFTWSWGDGTSESRTYYNNGVSPDPRPSPDGTFPFTATDSGVHPYGDNGLYPVTLTVLDDDGGSTSWQGQIEVTNLPPMLAPFGPFDVDEGSLFSVEAGATDPGSDDLTFEWTFELGSNIINIHYADGIGPDPPLSPGGIYPFVAFDTVSLTYGDNGVYVVTLTVTDDDGGSSSWQTSINVVNLPPSILPFGPFEVNEADELSITANAIDQGSDDLTCTWTFEYGPTIRHIIYNDGIGPDQPKSPDGVFPFSVDDIAAHTYGDNGAFKIALEVEDDDGGASTYETTVTVLNVPPTIVDVKIFLLADVSLRISGEKWHDVILRLFEDGNEVGYAQVIRYPGSPNDQTVTLHDVEIALNRQFLAMAYYTPSDDPINGQPNGADPAWIVIEWENGEETTLKHAFNVMHPDRWIWAVDNLHMHGVGKQVHLRGTATDPGSDDLMFIWDSGDGRTLTSVYYNNGIGPDSYPSPQVNPITVMDERILVYDVPGVYAVALTVADDDGGMVAVTMTIRIGR